MAGPRHCITCSAIARMPLPTVGTHGDITRSFEKCVRPQKQQSPKQTRARSQISERFISCARASHTSAERDVKLPGETFLQRQTIGLSQPTRRDVVGRSTYAFLTKIGLSSRERKKRKTRMSEAAEAASFWIWHMRSQKKS